jgi:hypothetical protein
MSPCSQLRQLAGFLAAVLLIGCTGLPAYQIQIERPHKDALRAAIRLPHRLSAAAYREIAERELAALRSALRESERPLYEVEIQFYAPREDEAQELKAATFTWRDTDNTRVATEAHEAALILY